MRLLLEHLPHAIPALIGLVFLVRFLLTSRRPAQASQERSEAPRAPAEMVGPRRGGER